MNEAERNQTDYRVEDLLQRRSLALEKIDSLSDKGGADSESLCVGWSMAGMTAKEAFAS